ncbi:hypothetical protein RB653_007249 [Dictyostelium firmibasis]|uniref:Uncharacterized protein n=1 Tax=Dictyostelium firmibasis TaxID=79012 RepID=A0AAN7YLW9_9MYCE
MENIIEIYSKFEITDEKDQEEKNYIRIYNEDQEIQIKSKETKTFKVKLIVGINIINFEIYSRKCLGKKGSIGLNMDIGGGIDCVKTIDTPHSMDVFKDKNNILNFILTNRRNNLNKEENISFFTFEKSKNDRSTSQRNDYCLVVKQRNSAKKPTIICIENTHRIINPPLKKVFTKIEKDLNGVENTKTVMIINEFSSLSHVTYDLTILDKTGEEFGKGFVTITLNKDSTLSSKIFEIDEKNSKFPRNVLFKSSHHKGKGTQFIFTFEYSFVGNATS